MGLVNDRPTDNLKARIYEDKEFCDIRAFR